MSPAVFYATAEGTRLAFNGVMVTKVCPECGIFFALPEQFDDENQRLGQRGSWCCPKGHWRVYSESTEARLCAELERTKAAAQRTENDLLDRLGAEKALHEATEKERRRIVKRVEAGVCIHCNRSFTNLAQHMNSAHAVTPEGDLHQLVTAMLVHKSVGRGWVPRRDGTVYVRCGAQKIPAVRSGYRWRDVTCEDCKRDGGVSA